jgi:hypothetical protein
MIAIGAAQSQAASCRRYVHNIKMLVIYAEAAALARPTKPSDVLRFGPV